MTSADPRWCGLQSGTRPRLSRWGHWVLTAAVASIDPPPWSDSPAGRPELADWVTLRTFPPWFKLCPDLTAHLGMTIPKTGLLLVAPISYLIFSENFQITHSDSLEREIILSRSELGCWSTLYFRSLQLDNGQRSLDFKSLVANLIKQMALSEHKHYSHRQPGDLHCSPRFYSLFCCILKCQLITTSESSFI